MMGKLPIESYHDVTVIIDGKSINLYKAVFGMTLTCDRTDGWQLWDMFGDKKNLLGGEYNNNHFQIRFGNEIVFDNRK